MAWYVITSYPGQERKIRNAVTEENPNYSQPFECYILPVRNVLLHEGKSRENQKIGMVFLKTDKSDDIPDLLSVLSIKYNLHCHLMYDRINKRSLVVPDSQMKLFKEVHPEEIEELLLLSKPFKDYAAKNERYVIIDGPLKGLEGYKINLHKDKKLAVELGGMTLAINNIYSYKIARVFEPDKDPLFAHQQKDRMICHLIGCLQVNGFPDDAYIVLRFIIRQCHKYNDDFLLLEETLRNEDCIASVLSEKIDVIKLRKFFSLLDAVTAGYIQSLSTHFFKEYENPNLEELIPEQRILPFLTPTSGSFVDPQPKELTIEHKDFTELIRLVTLTELRLQGSKSKTVKVSYYVHVGKCKSRIFSSFDILGSKLNSMEEIINFNEFSIDSYISNGVKTIETLLQVPRNASNRSLLPKVMIFYQSE